MKTFTLTSIRHASDRTCGGVAFLAMSDPHEHLDVDLPEPEEVLAPDEPVPDDEREVPLDEPDLPDPPVDDDDRDITPPA